MQGRVRADFESDPYNPRQRRADRENEPSAFPFRPPRYGDDMKRIAAFTLVLLLAACGASDNDPGPGGVTVGEARALDEAAEMLEARRLPPEAIVSGDLTGTGLAEAEPAPPSQ